MVFTLPVNSLNKVLIKYASNPALDGNYFKPRDGLPAIKYEGINMRPPYTKNFIQKTAIRQVSLELWQRSLIWHSRALIKMVFYNKCLHKILKSHWESTDALVEVNKTSGNFGRFIFGVLAAPQDR